MFYRQNCQVSAGSVAPKLVGKARCAVRAGLRRNERDKAGARRLRAEYEDHIRQVEGAESKNVGTKLRLFSTEFERLSHEALQVERRTILKLRNEDAIADEVLRRIQRDIDLAEARLQHHHQ